MRDWFPTLDERTQERLRIYQIELLRWTAKINLISVNSEAQADRVHFADCIKAMEIFSKSEPTSEVWDIGSGNGFPGMVLGVLQPARKIMLVESDVRKASFLKNLALRLELPEVGVRNERIEQQPNDMIQVGICRGFAPLDQSLSSTMKVFSKGARFYHMKGPDWTVELARVPAQVCSTWNTNLLETYVLPEPRENENRVLLKSVKI